MRFESFASTLLVNPGSALGSKITFGMPRIHVASIIGPAAYPPTPNAATGWCLLRMRIASSKPGPRIARFFASVHAHPTTQARAEDREIFRERHAALALESTGAQRL